MLILLFQWEWMMSFCLLPLCKLSLCQSVAASCHRENSSLKCSCSTFVWYLSESFPVRGWVCDHDVKIGLSPFLWIYCTKPGKCSEIAKRQVAMTTFWVFLFVFLLWGSLFFNAYVLPWKFAFKMLGMIKDNGKDGRRSVNRARSRYKKVTLKLLNKTSSIVFLVSCDSSEKYHETKLLYLMIS